MTDFRQPMLRVNGIPLKLQATGGGPVVSWEDIGATTDRNSGGTINRSRRACKRLLSAKTAPYTWEDSANIADLVEGKGLTTGFEEAAPFMVNGWCAGVLLGSGSLTQNATDGQYLPGSLLLTTTAGFNAQVQFQNLLGLVTGPRGVTLTCWVKEGGAATLVELIKTGSGTVIALDHPSSTSLAAYYGSVQVITSPALTWSTDWHMATVVVRDTTITSAAGLSLYFDGVLVASAALPAQPFVYNDRDILQVGPVYTAGVSIKVDELTTYPFPLTDAQVAGLYQSQTFNAASSVAPAAAVPFNLHKVRNFPRVLIDGDGVGDQFYAIGHVVGASSLTSFRDPRTGALLTNARTLDLQFMEI